MQVKKTKDKNSIQKIIERVPDSYHLRVQELSQQILDLYEELDSIEAEKIKAEKQVKEQSEYIAEIERKLIEQLKLNKRLEIDNLQLEAKFINERREVELMRKAI